MNVFVQSSKPRMDDNFFGKTMDSSYSDSARPCKLRNKTFISGFHSVSAGPCVATGRVETTLVELTQLQSLAAHGTAPYTPAIPRNTFLLSLKIRTLQD